jgi:ubiquinone/menaquinone biosynthesis C-methylase UbiE
MEPVTGQRQHEQAARAARTYTAAADHYARPALGFWERWGAATVARRRLCSGDEVLDLCCGAGASALPAAQAVGLTGSVLGVDLAKPLLAWPSSARPARVSTMFLSGSATRRPPGFRAARSIVSCVSSECSSPPTCLRS